MGERPSVPGRISKSRTAVISSVPIVSFPYARGRVRSRKQEDILKEVRGLARGGV